MHIYLLYESFTHNYINSYTNIVKAFFLFLDTSKWKLKFQNFLCTVDPLIQGVMFQDLQWMLDMSQTVPNPIWHYVFSYTYLHIIHICYTYTHTFLPNFKPAALGQHFCHWQMQPPQYLLYFSVQTYSLFALNGLVSLLSEDPLWNFFKASVLSGATRYQNRNTFSVYVLHPQV